MSFAARWSRRRWVLTTIAVVLAMFTAATLRLFVFPATDAPRRVDAVVVLGGPGDRIAKGAELVRQGYASTLVLSLPGRCLHPVPDVRTLCFRPNPFSTQGEARYIAAAAKRYGWKTLIVVATTDQTTRARLRFERCTDVDIRYVPADFSVWQWPYRIAYEWAALGKALIWQRDC